MAVSLWVLDMICRTCLMIVLMVILEACLTTIKYSEEINSNVTHVTVLLFLDRSERELLVIQM